MEHKSCEACGNQYDKAFEISMAGKTYVFDSFECAINVLAPECEHCGNRIIGHGVEANGVMFCCAHCAKNEGEHKMRDRADFKEAAL